MPKEVVMSSELFSGNEPEIGGMVELRWSREAEYVQIATVLAHLSTHEPETREVSGGWYVSMNRHGMNKLIRDLRRARDQAFGRDE